MPRKPRSTTGERRLSKNDHEISVRLFYGLIEGNGRGLWGVLAVLAIIVLALIGMAFKVW